MELWPTAFDVYDQCMKSVLKLLMDLVAIPSINPAFIDPGHAWAGERQIAQFIGGLGEKNGLEVSWQEVLPERSNVILRLLPSGKIKKRLLLAPHLDTVMVQDEGLLVPRQVGRRLIGRGSCDTKGSVAVMLFSMLQLASAAARPKNTEIIFVGLIDEENGQLGSRALVRNKFKADLAIVGEPTELQLVTAHKGDLWLRFETRGKSAHGARPELGENAVHEMSKVVCALEQDYADLLRKRKNKVLGSPTISVGVIAGGAQANIVPDQCLMLADRRTIPGETETMVKREILTLLKSKNIKVRFHNSKNAPCLPMETGLDHPWVKKMLGILDQKDGHGVDYFCDASVLFHAGIPSVVFGPGNIAQAHTSDEWIEISQLEKGVQILRRFMAELP